MLAVAVIVNSGPEIKNRCTLMVSVSAITCPRYKKAGCVPCYSLVHLSGRRFRYASGLDPGGMAAVLLSTSDR